MGGDVGIALFEKGQWHDSKTNLIWSRCSLGQQWIDSACEGDAILYKWHDAMAQVQKLDNSGFKEWRIPTINELKTLMKKGKEGYAVPAKALFPPRQKGHSGSFWSSSSYAGNKNNAWIVYFYNGSGDVPDIKYATNFVRLVRSGK